MATIRLHSYLVRLIWICIAPLLLLLGAFAFRALDDARQDEAREARALAQNVANSIDRQLNARIAALQMLATSPLALHPSRWQELHDTAKGYHKALGNHVLFADASGRMLFNTRLPWGTPLAPLLRPKGKSAAGTALKTGNPAVGDTVKGPNGTPIVAIAVPIRVADINSYLILTTIEAMAFQKHFEETAVPANWTITLADSTQAIIARRGTGHGSAGDASIHSVGLAEAPWSVSVETPRSSANRALADGAIALAMLILATVLAGYAGGRLASRRLAQSLDTLASDSDKPAPPGSTSSIVEIEAIRQRLASAAEAQQASERNLAASERRLRLAQDAAHAGTWEWDITTNRNYWSDEVFRLYGYEPGSCEASYDNWLAAIHPDDRQGAAETVAAAAQENKPITIEWRVQPPGGELRWLMSRGQPQFDTNGRLQGYLGIAMDITEHKLAEDRLRIWAEAFEQSGIGLAIGDPVTQLIHSVNPAFTHRRGYARNELVGQPVSVLFPPERLPEVMTQVRRASETGHVNFETEHLCRNGDRFPVMLDITVIKDAQGRPVSRLVHALDITERKQAEARLHESQKRLRRLVAAIPDLVWLKDVEGSYLACNTRFELFLGAPQAEIIGKTDYDFLDREQADQFRASDRATVESGRPHVSEKEIDFASDGHRELIQTIKTPLFDDQGQVIAVLGVARDITQIRENERELERYKLQLEDIVRQRTEDLAAAHEKLKHDAARIADLYDRAPVGYHSLDASGTILEVNETELAMLGYSRDEFIGHNIAEFHTPESLELFKLRYPEFLKTGHIRNLEFELLRKDGRKLPVLISGDAHPTKTAISCRAEPSSPTTPSGDSTSGRSMRCRRNSRGGPRRPRRPTSPKAPSWPT